MSNVIFKYGDFGCLLFCLGNIREKITVPNPGHILKYWLYSLCSLELKISPWWKFQNCWSEKSQPHPKTVFSPFHFSFFFSFYYYYLSLSFSLFLFFFFFPFLCGSISGNMRWNNIPLSLPRGKDTCISKDASMQCYLGTLKWNIQLLFHLSAARQQQVTRGNILLLRLSATSLRSCIAFLSKKRIKKWQAKLVACSG